MVNTGNALLEYHYAGVFWSSDGNHATCPTCNLSGSSMWLGRRDHLDHGLCAPVIARLAVVVGSELPQGVAVDHVVPRIQARVDRYPFGQRSEVAQPAGRGD
jgi:hypothetical protein